MWGFRPGSVGSAEIWDSVVACSIPSIVRKCRVRRVKVSLFHLSDSFYTWETITMKNGRRQRKMKLICQFDINIGRIGCSPAIAAACSSTKSMV